MQSLLILILCDFIISVASIGLRFAEI